MSWVTNFVNNLHHIIFKRNIFIHVRYFYFYGKIFGFKILCNLSCFNPKVGLYISKTFSKATSILFTFQRITLIFINKDIHSKDDRLNVFALIAAVKSCALDIVCLDGWIGSF